ncbi:MAG: transporter ATP-binding protein [Verrucomicrobiaceae bacterium]|nr:transporter ATP-binding protein [Verrucomicrobiaceae bacterium]
MIIQRNMDAAFFPLSEAMSTSPPPLASAAPVSIVEISHAAKSFGPKVALQDITFAIPAGQICGLLGPNGAGKTTLFRLLMGILKASSGELRVGGLDAFEDRVEVKRLVGFLPDEPVFYSYLSGREILELSAGLHGLDVPATMLRLAPLIARLELSEAIHLFAEDYSRGMKKKLGLLLALLHQPRLLILDEPTNGLDVDATRLFYDLVKEEAERGTTVLFSTHLMDHVSRLCSHAAILHQGRLVASGSLDELRAGCGEDLSLEEVFLSIIRNRPMPA